MYRARLLSVSYSYLSVSPKKYNSKIILALYYSYVRHYVKMCYFYVQDTLLDNLYTNLKIFFISYIIMRPHKFVRYYKFYKMELK